MQLHAAVEKILHLNKTLTMSEYSEITNVWPFNINAMFVTEP
jgi:hypothetical protein